VKPDSYLQYEILRHEDGRLWELGRGAMGITYKVHDTALRCIVALKVINDAYLGSEMAKERFFREARAAAALRHENVASVFYLGTAGQRHFYTMEFVDGETLDAYVKGRGSLEPIEALEFALQVSHALAAADKQQLIHRDLKPSNLMLTHGEDGEPVIKVIDFGLARHLQASGEDSGMLTVASGFVGTPEFASPEQVEEGDIDIRSDIYSVGVTLYFMLTGQRPFSGSTGQIMSQHLHKPIPLAPLTKSPDCVVNLIEQMTAKDRNKRPQTPRDLEKRILSCLQLIREASDTIPGESSLGYSIGQIVHRIAECEPGTVLSDRYRILRALDELPEGRQFLAKDLRHDRLVSLLVLSRQFVLDEARFAALDQAVDKLLRAPHPALRKIFCLERIGKERVLVDEHVEGPMLKDVLRARSFITPPEVAWLVANLAPLADHARANGLQHVDFTLSGIQLNAPELNTAEKISALLLRPLTEWESLEPKVKGIDSSVSVTDLPNWSGSATLITTAIKETPRSSYVRQLSLLGYELLGGPRFKLETTGRFTPIAALSEDANTTLRRGIIEDFSSARDAAEALALCFNERCGALSQPRTVSSSQPVCSLSKAIASREIKQRNAPRQPSENHRFLRPHCRWILLAAFLCSGGIGLLLSYCQTPRSTVAVDLTALPLNPTPRTTLAPVSIPALESTTGQAEKSTQTITPIASESPIRTQSPVATVNYYEARGEELARQYQWDSAIAYFTNAIESDSTNASFYANLAFAYFAKIRDTSTRVDSSNKNNALNALNKALDLSPNDSFLHAQRGTVYRSMSRYEDALAEFDLAISEKPDFWSAFGLRGQAYWHLKQWGRAISDLTQAINHDAGWPLPDWYPPDQYPPDPRENGHLVVIANYYWMRGTAYKMSARIDEARADYEHAGSIDYRKHL
jgi:serine/threonine protein kinase